LTFELKEETENCCQKTVGREVRGRLKRNTEKKKGVKTFSGVKELDEDGHFRRGDWF